MAFPKDVKLTQSKTSIRRHHDGFPTIQFLILALCRLAEPIAITSIFPYAWLMVSRFQIGSRNDASFYTGILVASFSLAESVSAMWWGSLSDRIGRKPILLFGCFGTLLSLLVVGFAPNFTVALVGRLAGGLLNGNIAVVQTMVGELVTRPEHEPKAYSIMPFVWSIGTIVGPCIGGLLANPSTTYPDVFSADGFFAHFPWALPNIVCAAFMFISIIAGYLFLEETHPHLRKDADPCVYHHIVEQTPMITAAGMNADPGVDLRQESYGTFNEVEVTHDKHWQANADGSSTTSSPSEEQSSDKWLTWRVAMLTVALGIYSYHSMCYDHLLPIFFQDKRADEITVLSTGLFAVPGGLGLSIKSVGLIMSVNGLIALFVQAVIFPFAAERLGVWRLFIIVTILHPIAYVIVPCLALLPENFLYTGIYTCLTIRNIFTIIAYPVLLILLKQASVAPSVLGRINGLAASAGAASRTIAPPVAGLLYGWGLDIGFTGLAYWGAGAVALIGVAQLYLVPRERHDISSVKSIVLDFPETLNKEVPGDAVEVTFSDSEETV